MLPLRFAPYHQLDGVPNVIVDGSVNDSTRIVLSHWPGSPTPKEVLDDLSAQIAFRALDYPSWFDGIDVVTNNHFDQDGLCSVYALTNPVAAMERRELVVDVARAGDFGTYVSRDAARMSFVIATFEDPQRSPLDPKTFVGSYPEQCGRLYEAVLPKMTELLDHPARFRDLWDAEDAHLQSSIDAIDSGVVRIDEHPELDLAIVTVPQDWAERTAHRFTQTRLDAVHPMAVNQATSCLRLLVMQDRDYRIEYRYETWVMYVSRAVKRRPDLRPLAAIVNEIESSESRWSADGPGSLTPRMRLDGGDSTIAPEEFIELVTGYLRTAPGAWDPFSASPTQA